MRARAIARKTAAQSGNPRAPLLCLTHQIVAQGHSGTARRYDLVSQPHRRISQYTHFSPPFQLTLG
jgi:hypothetical protein